ncbi:pVSP [Giardia muris]|uniref:PVSP n=1 Tax=Giardia muris TaxID=5742 RepID=A0A4Z1T6B9_GIAMU|nr:pVSP [Giardia muris]|eukprot:TNJ28011.1 pVSP [Giardia muris]
MGVKNARALSCTEGGASGNCKAGSCLDLGTLGKVCKECATTTEASIDGTCSSTVGSNTCSNGVCTACDTSGTKFLFYGGCYDQGSVDKGAALCSAASSGLCTTRATAATSLFARKDQTGSETMKNGLYECSDDSPAAGGVSHCSSCDDNPQKDQTVTCNGCEDGFYLDGGKCVPCTDSNCLQCDAKDQCNTCKEGFGPVLDSAQASISSCTDCTALDASCTSCANLGLGLFCSACKDGKVPIDGKCVDVNDKLCTASSGSCSACLNGHTLYLGGCYSPDKAAVLGLCAKESQVIVGSASVCSQCQQGFVPIDGSCAPIKAVNTVTRSTQNICLKADGTTAVDAKATKCEACIKTQVGTSDYFLFNGGCYPMSAGSSTVGDSICSAASNGVCSTVKATSGFYLDNGNIVQCPGGCQCTSSTTCTACTFGYVAETSGATTTCKACSSVISGCTTCTADKCTLCWDGSTPTKDACPSPPSSSSSGLSGGAIAGIVIAVLLVLGGLGGFLGWWFGCRGK